MKVLLVLSLFCLLAVISAKKHYEENIESLDAESRGHGEKKYSKEHQKSHYHGHKHKKPSGKEEKVVEEPHFKSAPVDIPEMEAELQGNIETSKKAVHDQKQKEQVEDLHLQDLTYEENLKKDKKKKKSHHGAHHAEVVEKNEERKLFAEHEAKNPAEKKVIEDSFEPLTDTAVDNEKRTKKDKKSKDKPKNKKKAYEKSKDKSKKSKDGKKKNKDKKNKNKDKKW